MKLIFAIVVALAASGCDNPFAGKLERQTVGNLGAMRSSLSIYYGDMEGQYPAEPTALGKRWMLEKIPVAHTHDHGGTTAIRLISGADYAAKNFNDTGGWFYVVDGPLKGNVGVDCTHNDFKGKLWNSY